jgi:2-C-methyl-D-erythritol 4-phosphate cytidylyltransferase
VVAESKYEKAKNVLSEFISKGAQVVIGGSRRQDSVRNGLEAISECTFVAIHDGARPCVALDVLKRGLDAVEYAGAVVPAVPVVDTFKKINESDQVLTTLERNSIRLIQTPQIFEYDLVLRAHRDVLRDSPDDAFMVEQIGEPVTLFDGDPDNIKVTRPTDLKIAESILISNRGD